MAGLIVSGAVKGTTGTSLDRIVDLLGKDQGLTNRITGADLREGQRAADGVNGLIIAAIQANGLANDGTITTSDVYSINSWIASRHMGAFTAFHGDDEGDIETGFHTVQSDGGHLRLFGQNGIDGVLDSIYHIGFSIREGRFVNEDGDANATVEDVAFWLSDLLAPDLAAGTLVNARADPQFHGTTGTGLDRLIEIIVDDAGLNDRISHAHINAGARAGDGINLIIVEAIRATGIADDGDIDEIDLIDVNRWIRANRLAEFTAFHGDDEGTAETGYHLVQGDGGTAYLFDEKAVDTIGDGLYHIGFDIQWGRFANEDGAANASLSEVSQWLTLLLKDDLASGALASGRAAVDPATIADDIVFAAPRTVTVEAGVGAVEYGRRAETALINGTIAFSFTASSPDDGRYQVLFSKDGASNLAGDISAFLHDGELTVLLQDGRGDHWIDAGPHVIEAGQRYDFALSYGRGGVQLWLNGEKVASEGGVTANLSTNTRSLVVGGGTWGRNASDPRAIWNHFDGTIEDFAVYDRALSRFEIDGLSTADPLPQAEPGDAARIGAAPAIRAGTGLSGQLFDRASSFASIDELIAQATTQTRPNALFSASRVDFGGRGESATLATFLDDAGTVTSGAGAIAATTIGLRLTGFVWIPAGDHVITVRSDDGFLLKLGGETVSRYSWDRGFDPTSTTIDSAGGLYAIDLFYHQNSGGKGLRLEIDGETVGAGAFFRSVADYDAALAANGAMPAEGLPDLYAGPVGTTGTGLDALVRMIGEDEGLAHNLSAGQIAAGAAAADTINHLIVEAINNTGAAEDGVITVSEVYDLSDYIRLNHEATFIAAHGNDEGAVETAFHIIQGDGGTTRLYGDQAVDTVADGLYHIGFATVGDRFANEDGNANARVETVAYWLNTLLREDLGHSTPAAPGLPNPGLGGATDPNVVSTSAGNSVLGTGALTLTLAGTARNGRGNTLANRLSGNEHDNILDGGDGDDRLLGGEGDDTLVGGRGADVLAGGWGDDQYWLDDAGDEIIETAARSGGIDSVRITGGFTAFRLSDGLENLDYAGSADFSAGGNAAANVLATDRGDDRLSGGDGNDALSGGIGADIMAGGEGSDSYSVDNAGDVVIEAADAGYDRVFASVSYRLSANVDALALIGMDDLNGTGNTLANRIDGNDGDNVLNGGGGADRLTGGRGDDTYLIANAGVVIVEAADGGVDLVRSDLDIELGRYVENAFLTGAAARTITGNSLANELRGNAGANAIEGGAADDLLSGADGNDVLTGGTGADLLIGGLGSDRFVYLALGEGGGAANTDRIADFSRAQRDRIDLSAIDAVEGGGNDAFRLAAGFTGHAGELRIRAIGSSWLVEGDVNGDSVADLAFRVTSAAALGAADFLL